MSLSPTWHMGLRTLTDEDAKFRADVNGLMGDVREAVWSSGTALPTQASTKWAGRSFFHTGERAWYVCDGVSWLPVGGVHTISLGEFGSTKSGYSFDAAGGASYVYRNGRRIDVRLRIKRNTGVLLHGSQNALFTTSAAFRPAGVGSWPLAANQAGGGQGANAVAAAIDADGAVFVLSPSGDSTTLELNGSYYIP